MSALNDIMNALANKHRNDVFVPECKLGPSNGGLRIMDAWAMSCSWANPHTYGYEVKIARGDFLADRKWHHYLPACNYFSFVAPKGFIDPQELPPEVGLYRLAGSRVVVVRKPVRREVPLHEGVIRYVLMWRAKIGPDRSDNQRYWRDWLACRNEKRELGYMVSKQIRETVGQALARERKANDLLRGIDELRKKLADHGINLDDATEWDGRRKIIDKLTGRDDQQLLRQLQRDARTLALRIDAVLSPTKVGS